MCGRLADAVACIKIVSFSRVRGEGGCHCVVHGSSRLRGSRHSPAYLSLALRVTFPRLVLSAYIIGRHGDFQNLRYMYCVPHRQERASTFY